MKWNLPMYWGVLTSALKVTQDLAKKIYFMCWSYWMRQLVVLLGPLPESNCRWSACKSASRGWLRCCHHTKRGRKKFMVFICFWLLVANWLAILWTGDASSVGWTAGARLDCGRPTGRRAFCWMCLTAGGWWLIRRLRPQVILLLYAEAPVISILQATWD